MAPRTALGEMLQNRRQALKLTQQQAADMLGRRGIVVHPNSISRWECGTSTPEAPTLEVVLDCYGMTGELRTEALVAAHEARAAAILPALGGQAQP